MLLTFKLPMQTIGLRPMHERPRPGQVVTVLLRDGTQLDNCHATSVVLCGQDKRGIVIYYKRKAVDELLAKGWWPKIPNVELSASKRREEEL